MANRWRLSLNRNDWNQDLKKSTSKRLAFLDSMRAIAIIMVVGVHSTGYCVTLPTDKMQIVSFIVHSISVPVFFLADGYLFARSVLFLKNYNYIKYIRGSLFRLIVPWLVFTLIYTFARYAFELIGFLDDKMIVGHSWQEVAISAYGSVYAPQMYFLFSLFLIRLCSPIFKNLLFKKNLFFIIFLFLCFYAAYKSTIPFISQYLAIDGGQEPVLHALWGIQFYLTGAILFVASETFNLKKLFIPSLLFFILSIYIKNRYSLEYFGYIIQYQYLLTFFLFFICVQTEVPLLNLIGKNTMGIYLIHAPIVLKGVSLILIKFVSIPLLSFLSILLGTFILSVFIVLIINSIPYGVLLFGTPYRQK
jgi:surface polysaccharide O-acyltransferase-like enzyme